MSPIVLQAQRQNAINLINVKETVITDTYLMYQTYPQSSEDSEVIYTLLSPPSKGLLLLSSSGSDLLSSSAAVKLRPGSTFNQVDLLSGHLKYKLTALNDQTSLDDVFTFKVGVHSDISSAVTTMEASIIDNYYSKEPNKRTSTLKASNDLL